MSTYELSIFGDIADAVRDAMSEHGFAGNRIFLAVGDEPEPTVPNCVRIVVGQARPLANLGGGLALMDQSFDVICQMRMHADDGKRDDERLIDPAKGLMRLAHRVRTALDNVTVQGILGPILLVASAPPREHPKWAGWLTQRDTYNIHWERTAST